MRDGRFEPVPGTERELPADAVFLAMGFTGPERGPLLDQLERGARRARQRAPRRGTTCPASTACSSPATPAGGSRSSSGRSPRAARRPRRSTAGCRAAPPCRHRSRPPPARSRLTRRLGGGAPDRPVTRLQALPDKVNPCAAPRSSAPSVPPSRARRGSRSLVEAGMDVARMNLSPRRLRRPRADLRVGAHGGRRRRPRGRHHGRPPGPEDPAGHVRRRSGASSSVGAEFTITIDDVPGDVTICSTTYKGLPGDVNPGDCDPHRRRQGRARGGRGHRDARSSPAWSRAAGSATTRASTCPASP